MTNPQSAGGQKNDADARSRTVDQETGDQETGNSKRGEQATGHQTNRNSDPSPSSAPPRRNPGPRAKKNSAPNPIRSATATPGAIKNQGEPARRHQDRRSSTTVNRLWSHPKPHQIPPIITTRMGHLMPPADLPLRRFVAPSLRRSLPTRHSSFCIPVPARTVVVLRTVRASAAKPRTAREKNSRPKAVCQCHCNPGASANAVHPAPRLRIEGQHA